MTRWKLAVRFCLQPSFTFNKDNESVWFILGQNWFWKQTHHLSEPVIDLPSVFFSTWMQICKTSCLHDFELFCGIFAPIFTKRHFLRTSRGYFPCWRLYFMICTYSLRWLRQQILPLHPQLNCRKTLKLKDLVSFNVFKSNIKLFEANMRHLFVNVFNDLTLYFSPILLLISVDFFSCHFLFYLSWCVWLYFYICGCRTQ